MTKAIRYPNVLEEPRARKDMIERMESLRTMLNPNYFYSRHIDRQEKLHEIFLELDKLIEKFKAIPSEPKL